MPVHVHVYRVYTGHFVLCFCVLVLYFYFISQIFQMSILYVSEKVTWGTLEFFTISQQHKIGNITKLVLAMLLKIKETNKVGNHER